MNGAPYVPALTARAIEERKSWQYRAIAYCHGNKSQIGALIVAILGRKVNPPCFHPYGMNISEDGIVTALYKPTLNEPWRVQRVYENVQQFTDIFRGLADALQLDDAERMAMFDEIRKFVRIDRRVKTNLFD